MHNKNNTLTKPFPFPNKGTHARRNTEVYGPWLMLLAIGCLSEIGAVAKHDTLGIIYAGRLIVSVSLVLALQYHLTSKNKKTAHA